MKAMPYWRSRSKDYDTAELLWFVSLNQVCKILSSFLKLCASVTCVMDREKVIKQRNLIQTWPTLHDLAMFMIWWLWINIQNNPCDTGNLWLWYLLIPMSLMADAGGPINITPSLLQSSANSVFSERNP